MKDSVEFVKKVKGVNVEEALKAFALRTKEYADLILQSLNGIITLETPAVMAALTIAREYVKNTLTSESDKIDAEAAAQGLEEIARNVFSCEVIGVDINEIIKQASEDNGN